MKWLTQIPLLSLCLVLASANISAFAAEIGEKTWNRLIVNGSVYNINILPKSDVTLSGVPLSKNNHDAVINYILVRDKFGNRIADPELEKQIVIDAQNYALLKDSSKGMSFFDHQTSVNEADFSERKSGTYSIWLPYNSADWWKKAFVTLPLDDPNLRVSNYKKVLMNAILQTELYEKMLEDGTIDDRTDDSGIGASA